MAAAALAASVASHLVPPGEEAVAHRQAALATRAAAALEADGRTLRDIADRIQRMPDFAGIVDAGGTEIRPARLFSLLGDALPRGPGWGAVFFDAAGRAVAWGGEAAETPRGRPDFAGPNALFHVTRFTLTYSAPRGTGADRKGVLVTSRRYPTGILTPELAEYQRAGGLPTRLRLRARAEPPPRLVSVFTEPAPREWIAEEVSRQRALPFALAGTGALLILGAFSGAPAAGVVAARFLLLLGTPRASYGIFEALSPEPDALGLLSTPVDLFLSGLALLFLVARFARASAGTSPAVPRRAVLTAVRVASGLLLATVTALGARYVGLRWPGLFDGMGLTRGSLAAYLAESGGVMLGAGALGIAAVLLGRAVPERWPWVASLSGILALAFATRTARGSSTALVCLGAVLIASALAPRMIALVRLDLLGRAATAVLLFLSTVLVGAAGLSDGKLKRLDDALERAEAHEKDDAARRQQTMSREWSTRIFDPALEPWLPAGRSTLISDLARALWVRGAGADYPGHGDLLTIRDREEVVSSFGVTRPGIESGRTSAAEIPVSGLSAGWRENPDLLEGDLEPLLVAAVAGDIPERVLVERVEYDAAGRPRRRGADRADLPRSLVVEARRLGLVEGSYLTNRGFRRVLVKTTGSGFVSFGAPGSPLLVTVGAAVAAGEAALPIAFLVFGAAAPAARRPRRKPAGPVFGTFRARLVALVLVFGAIPLAGSVLAVRLALERHTLEETRRHARVLLAEARRTFESAGVTTPGPAELNRTAAVIGTDLLLYKNGSLVAASRALPVAAEVAPDRLSARVAEALAEGRSDAAATARRARAGGPRIVEAAEPLSPDGQEALAVTIAEDEAGRVAVDSLVLFAVAVALGAVGLGARSALALSRPVEELIEGAERIGQGVPAPPIEKPRVADLARLVEAFEAMGARVAERTESLAREREAAVGLLANLTAAVVLFRPRDGAVLLSNPTADRILPGGTREASSSGVQGQGGAKLWERVSSAEWAPLRETLSRAVAKGAPFETRVSADVGGASRVFRVVVAPLPPEGGEARSLLLLEDLTDFIRAERLTGWVDAARAIAHDVKNPLTPIRLASERLLRLTTRGDSPAPGLLVTTANGILKQVEILTERIGRLARFSDPAALERVRFDRGTTESLLSEVASDYAAHETIRVSCRVDADLPPFFADRILLRDALANFVLNAVEAIGGTEGRITLGAEGATMPDGLRVVRLVCEDDGPGVPEDEMSRLFDPTFSTKSRGSGMGLAATRRAADRHSGTVFAEPANGEGLRIGMILPAAE